jgi:hypothetical protein
MKEPDKRALGARWLGGENMLRRGAALPDWRRLIVVITSH